MKRLQLIRSFTPALLSHIDWCIDDQLTMYKNETTLEDYKPLYMKLGTEIINEHLKRLPQAVLDTIQVDDDAWCSIHDTIDWGLYIKYSDKVIRN